MKHISLVKIIVALCICNVYVFTCGVMGVVGDGKSAVDSSPDGVMGGESYDAPGTGEAPPSGVGTVDFIVPNAVQTEAMHLEELHFAAPGLANSPVQSSYDPEEDTEPPIIDTFDAIAPVEETDEPIHIGNTYEPEDEPPATTPAATTTPATTTTAATTTPTTPPTTPETTPETTPPTTVATPATTPQTLPIGGIPVNDDEPIPVDSGDDIPDYTEPPEVTPNTEAANEILYVTVSGMTVSGKAVDIV